MAVLPFAHNCKISYFSVKNEWTFGYTHCTTLKMLYFVFKERKLLQYIFKILNFCVCFKIRFAIWVQVSKLCILLYKTISLD